MPRRNKGRRNSGNNEEKRSLDVREASLFVRQQEIGDRPGSFGRTEISEFAYAAMPGQASTPSARTRIPFSGEAAAATAAIRSREISI